MAHVAHAAILASLLAVCACEPPPGVPAAFDASAGVAGWPVTGGDAGGSRYSPLRQITPENVLALETAWVHHTGDLPASDTAGRNHSFQATPVLAGDTLYLCTPRSRVVALDARTGERRWLHDPAVQVGESLAEGPYNLNCRGVAVWDDPEAAAGDACARRVFVATADARLLALDVASGAPCAGFGEDGAGVDLADEMGELLYPGEYGMSSPPVVVGDRVIVGSMVLDNQRVEAPSGRVRAYDARTGASLWAWDPVPERPSDPRAADWQSPSGLRTGAANAWSLLSVDEARDLVFVPTGSASPDFYGGERLGANRWANSVVALRAATGERVWSFQTVHHDLWDYDVPAQPVLAEIERDGARTPAVVQVTKMGHVFVLHRETGEPLFPVEERPVPASDVPGERAARTQPFPTLPPPLVPQALRPEDAWGFTFWDRGACRERIAALRSEGIFTPPSREGTVIFPGVGGGANWGSAAVDPVRQVAVVRTTRVAQSIRLVPREAAGAERPAGRFDAVFPQRGSPYVGVQETLLSPLGAPCNRPPWGAVSAVDLATGGLLWEVPHGTTADMAPFGIGLALGVPGAGGPIVTASGLVFIAAAADDYLRAFALEDGRELWRGRLPAGGQATPMTYRLSAEGRQYVVIAAGGHAQLGTTRGDAVVAFALPEPDRTPEGGD